MQNEKVSVIIPTYNRGYCLEETINSVLTQTYTNIELLICDDGSTDNTFDILDKFSDSRLQLVQGPRGGRPAIPRNRGLKEATGEWIAFLDSDDIWLPDKLKIQIDLLQVTGCLASSTNALRMFPNKEVAGKFHDRIHDRINFNDLVATNWVICSSVIMHRSLLDKIQLMPEKAELTAIEDYAYWLRLASCTDFAYSATPLLKYMDNPTESIRKSGSQRAEEQRQLVMNDFEEWSITQLKSNEANKYIKLLKKQWLSPKENSIRKFIKIILNKF